jgi:RNA polymerase subunit RPABC4/transcription elongation factor Spt4
MSAGAEKGDLTCPFCGQSEPASIWNEMSGSFADHVSAEAQVRKDADQRHGFKAWQRSEGWRRGGRCERELFYESQGLDPRNCITDDRELCPVCLEIVMREEREGK